MKGLKMETNIAEVEKILRNHHCPTPTITVVKMTVNAFNINPIFEEGTEERERLIMQYYAGFIA